MSFGKRSIVLLALVRAALAQDPPAPPSPAPLDLPAIAKLLEGDGKLPDVLAAMPARERGQLLKGSKLFTLAERDAAIEDGGDWDAVAVGVMAASDS